MTDKDNGFTLGRHLFQCVEKLSDFRRRQNGGGLVKNKETTLAAQ